MANYEGFITKVVNLIFVVQALKIILIIAIDNLLGQNTLYTIAAMNSLQYTILHCYDSICRF